jgi:predicted short-subunit dehydrogenase-like oxidoreductase (DUF2520 family)
MEPAPDTHAPLPAVLLGKTVAILGAGKVGCAVGDALRGAGLPVVAVTTRHAQTAADAAERTGARAGTDNATAAAAADIVLLTTNDDAIAPVCSEVAAAGAFRPGQLVVHMSGALPLSILQPAASAGALVGCAHPLQSFATHEQAARDISGAVFGVTSGPGAAEQLEALVNALGGHSVTVPEDKKTLYHVAAVVASNYLVAVEDLAQQLLLEVGLDEPSAAMALQPLTSVTLGNLSELGTTNALTGPIARGDTDTVRRHLETLDSLPADWLQLYKALGRHTLAIAERRGALGDGALEQLRRLLARE